jgi:hypothetical protein
MKKITKIVLIVSVVLLVVISSFAQLVPNLNNVKLLPNANVNLSNKSIDNSCYGKEFTSSATGLNKVNAYLLMYLSTAIYADLITQLDEPNTSIDNLKVQGDILQKNESEFVKKFRKVMNPLLFRPNELNINLNTIFFNVAASNTDGYDPEVMVINKEDVIYVVWRGTDRVQNKSGILNLDYGMREWFQTDFNAFPLQLNSPFVGKVHTGSWESMLKIASTVANKIEDFGGKNKNVWITGHSLGAGIAQLFANYLAKTRNIKAQGVYTFATPQFSDETFNADLIKTLGGENKLQRFDFIDDPISCFAQIIPTYKPVGQRNLFSSLDNMIPNTVERSGLEIARIVAGVPFAITTITPVRSPVSGGMCYHHQHWYLNAAYRQLSSIEKSKMPNPLDYNKIANENCSEADFARAENKQNLFNTLVTEPLVFVTNVVNDGIDAVADFSHDFTNYLNEFTSNPLPDNYSGYYRIKNLHSGKYLSVAGRCKGRREFGFMQWSGNEIGDNATFRIEKYELGGLNFGYSIRLKNTNAVVDVDAWHINDNIQLQTWSKNWPGTPNQAWVFKKVGNNAMHFVIQNKQSRKVMDIRGDYTVNGKAVTQHTYVKNRAPQVWILEKVQ